VAIDANGHGSPRLHRRADPPSDSNADALPPPRWRANIPSVTVATSEADMTPRIRQTLSTWSVNGSLVTITGDTMPPRDPNDDDDDEDDDDAEPDEDSEPAVVREPDE
jgi:hypothetical protein